MTRARLSSGTAALVLVGSLVAACSSILGMENRTLDTGAGGTSSSSGKGGGGGGDSSTGSGQGDCSACPPPESPCQEVTCDKAGKGCGYRVLKKYPGEQTPGDCHTLACDAAGNVLHTVNDSDAPDTGTTCITQTCKLGDVQPPNFANAGTGCSDSGGHSCDGSGSCVECIYPSQCSTKGAGYTCSHDRCVPDTCTNGTQGELETDIDCGGGDCPSCADGKHCGGPTDCESLVCTGGTCTPCAQSADCPIGDYCNTTSHDCAPKLDEGAACGTDDSACTSTHCVDGVCCGSTCSGSCVGCSAAKKGEGVDGVCGSVVVGTTESGCTGCSADGTGKDTGKCDGNGACQASSCSPYVCNTGACRSNCTADADCAGGFWCAPANNPGAPRACVPTLGQGATCSQSGQCTSGCCQPTSHACSPTTCCDGAKDGDETGKDCGGSCGGTCPIGQGCSSAKDCANGAVCLLNLCTVPL